MPSHTPAIRPSLLLEIIMPKKLIIYVVDLKAGVMRSTGRNVIRWRFNKEALYSVMLVLRI
jgi:hypothetical protein